MSKYFTLWKFIENKNETILILSFEEIKTILGFEINHSFLNYKKDLLEYGFIVDKISLKNKTITFCKQKERG